MKNFVEIIMDAEVASASHDVVFCESVTNEVRINAINVEAHGWTNSFSDEIDAGVVMEEFMKLSGVGLKVLAVGFGAGREPINRSAKGDDFAPSLEPRLEDGISVSFIARSSE